MFIKRFYIEVSGEDEAEVEEAVDVMSDAALSEKENAGYNVDTEYGHDDIKKVIIIKL